MQVRKVKFSELRNAYLIVKKHIEKTCNKPVNSTRLRIAEDLCLHGDDNYELISDMVKTYQLDFDGFDYDEHFVNEAHVFNPYAALAAIVLFPLYVVKFAAAIVVRPFSASLSSKLKDFKLTTVNNYQRSATNDLTVGDLIASLIEKRFTLRRNIKFIMD